MFATDAANRRVGIVALAIILLLGGAFGATIWRYQHSRSDGAKEVEARGDELHVGELPVLLEPLDQDLQRLGVVHAWIIATPTAFSGTRARLLGSRPAPCSASA